MWTTKFSLISYLTDGACTYMGDIPHGKVVPRTNHAEGSMVRYSCDDGYELIGDAYRICRNGQWTGTAARCQSRSNNQVTPKYCIH